ncbi:MAG TPA: glycine--tRNA ligase subunit beta, partial [Burkholderiales bacterium]|nr:glycine--tRNA ligase subunit beta [Burkholderiales bacterium]
YYAINDGESEAVANAIEAHYRPRFAGDRVPESHVACAVALADKLDTMAGLFGIGLIPTGEKDPFGLRRAALGVVRILIERDLPLSLHDLSNAAFAGYGGRVADVRTDLESFIFERLAGFLKDHGYSALEVASVIDRRQVGINQSLRVIEAVHAFNSLPEAQSLAAANKRVVNILKQAEARGESLASLDESWLQEPAERELFEALNVTSRQADSLLKQRDYTGYLKSFAVLKSPVDAFFDRVMVMVDSPELRHNRLALLADLREKMNRIADISKLVIEK